MSKRLEWTLLAVVVAAGAYLRFSQLDLIEFKGDEAYAAHLALQFVQGGKLPTAGLMSSVGVTNPPLFIYLIIPMFALGASVTFVSCCIAALSLAAIVACWWVGRKYYGPVAGLVAAAFFAVSPWAVIYSRKIWAQDFVPVFATATIWAVHAVVLGNKPKAIFWAVLLPLCVIQIHFSGIALTATVVAILVVLRPKVDWRFAVAGAAAAVLLAVPYLKQQSQSNWAEYRSFMAQRRGRNWNIPEGMTIQPDSGYPLPRPPSQVWVHAMAIVNAGQIEDVLGLSASPEIGGEMFKRTGAAYQQFFFRKNFSVTDALLTLQRVVFVVTLIYLAVVAVKATRKTKKFPWFTIADRRAAWILVLWVVMPLATFWVAELWTYLSYFAILMPAQFLALGAVAGSRAGLWQSKRSWGIVGVTVVFCAANFVFVTDLFGFIARNGGAHGTYGTVLAHKQDAARWLAQRADVQQVMAEQRLVQMDRLGRGEMPQLDLPFLAMIEKNRSGGVESQAIPTNTVVLVVDGNRADFNPQQIAQLATAPQTNFGPMQLYLLQK